MEEHPFKVHANDNQILQAMEWSNNVHPKGVIVLIHGLGEHSGRYAWVADKLVSSGFPIITMDLRGHGKTAGKRGHSPDYNLYMEDIAQLIVEAQKRFPGLPVFLYGHSLGGNLVINYALRKKPTLDGVIATSPGLNTAQKPPAWKTSIGRMLYQVYPTLTMDNGLDVSGLSQNPDVIKKYVEDPLVHKYISARLGIDVIDSGAWARQHAKEFSLPLLLLQGGKDRLVDPAANREFAKNIPGDITYREWEDGYHELHNEPFRDQVIEEIVTWIDSHLPPRDDSRHS